MRDPLAVGGHDGGKGAGRDGEADEVVVGQLEVRRAHDRDVGGELYSGEVALVAARFADVRGLLGRAAPHVDVEARPREDDGQRGPPRAGADDRHAADGGHAAEPLPLELDARPDPVGHRGRQRRRRPVDPRERQRPASPDPNLVRAEDEPLADSLAAEDRDRDDGGAGLEREPPDAALRPAERAGAGSRALREHQHAVAALQDRLCGGHRLLVRGAAFDRKRAQAAEQPGEEPVGEELALRHVVDRAARQHPDDERVEERAVVRRDDERALRGDVLAAYPAHPEVEDEEGLQEPSDEPVDERVHPAIARAGQQRLAIHVLGYGRRGRRLHPVVSSEAGRNRGHGG